MSSVKWFKGLSPEGKAQLKADLLAAMPAFKRLRELINEDIASLDAEARKWDNYALAAWPYIQADIQGSKRTLYSILETLPEESK